MSERNLGIALGAGACVIYLAAGFGLLTDYDYYGRLAQALLGGHWWLTEAPPWLNELVACGDGKWCVVYPPLPAIVTLPFAAVLPSALAQVLVSRLSAGVSAGILYHALRSFGAPRAVAVGGTVLSALGTTLFFSSVDGRAWFDAHAIAMPFLCGAFLFAARGERPVLVGALIGLATLSRLPIVATTPALALLLASRAGISWQRALAGVIAGGVPFGLVYLGYNVMRWGSPFDEGYAVLAVGDAFFTRGVFSLFYLPRHFVAIFLEPPIFSEGSPWFLVPGIKGQSLFFTTPAFLWIFAALRDVRRDRAMLFTALAALLALIPDVVHGTVGFAQFGYRFSLDAQPFLVALAVAGDARTGAGWRPWPSRFFLVVTAISILINLYAMIAITRFGFWQ